MDRKHQQRMKLSRELCARMGGFPGTWAVVAALLALVAMCGWSTQAMALSDTPNPNTWFTDGTVKAIVTDGDTVYIGGSFKYVGPNTGPGVPLDAATGSPAASFPRVNGFCIFAVVPDGSGGWYAGGSFSRVGSFDRQNLVHLLADGTVDSSWAPNPDYSVEALALSGSTLYVGGTFNTIAGQPRNNLAAFDITTGLLTTWDPNASGLPYSQVLALAVSGSTVYAGGYFTNIGGQARKNIAALDATSGLATDWNPDADYQVLALAVSGSTVYAGGNFTNIGGQARKRFAALDAASGLATDWDPNATGGVNALTVSGSTLYVGGYFNSIGGQTRNSIAAVDLTTGLPTDWDPNATGGVNALAVSGSTLYVGGYFSSIGGQTRNSIAAVDLTTGLPSLWNPSAIGGMAGLGVRALAVSGSTVYAGGDFVSVGAQPRNNLAALDAATGVATDWDPDANGTIKALAVSGSTVYVGGEFGRIGGLKRNNIAALDAATGVVTSWNAGASGPVNALAVSGSTVYAGGAFYAIGGRMRQNIGALDATAGEATLWNPSISSYWGSAEVSALAVNGSNIYVGGYFTYVGTAGRWYLAAIDTTSGLATSWDPDPSGTVNALAVSGETVYVGGFFTSIGGADRNRIAALDATTGLATAWNPNASSSWSPKVTALAVSGSTVFVGGSFTSIGGQTRNNIAGLDADTGLATTWDPNAGDQVLALAVNGSSVYAGGYFTSMGGQAQPCFAQFDEAEGTGHAISGTVTSGGVGLAGVTVSLSEAIASLASIAGKSTTTDGNGNYSFSGLADGVYTITPNKAGYSFTPSSITVGVESADVAGQDFTAAAISYTAAGKVTNGGSGLADVTINLSGAATQTTTTASDGTYSFAGLSDGIYTITPSKTGCSFTPASRTFNISGAGLTGQDFVLAVGSLKVSITPKAAVTAGARWKVDTGAWKPNGAKVTKLAIGPHTVAFKDITGWVTPTKQTVDITVGGTASATGAYQSLGADFTGSPTNGKTGLQIKFTDESTGPVKSWLWNFGDNSTSTVQNPLHKYSKPGTYTVTLTVKNGSCTSKKIKTDYITVYAAPKADFTGTPTSGKKPLSVQFADQSTGPVTSWSWTFGDTGTSTEQNPTHTYNKTGNYTVKLKVTGPGGTNTKTRTGYIKVQK